MTIVRIFQAVFCALGLIFLGASFVMVGNLDGGSTTTAFWSCTAEAPVNNEQIQNCSLTDGTTDSTALEDLGSVLSLGMAGIGSLLFALVLGSGRGSTGVAMPAPVHGPGWSGPPGPYAGQPVR